MEDSYVIEVALLLEQKYPGSVNNIELEILRPNGQPATDFDLVVNKQFILQVKQGGGSKVTRQAEKTKDYINGMVEGFPSPIDLGLKPNAEVLVFLPDKKVSKFVIKDARDAGFEVFTSYQELENHMIKNKK